MPAHRSVRCDEVPSRTRDQRKGCERSYRDKYLASFLGDHRGFVIRPRDGADCLNRIPERDGDELNLVARLSPEQVAARETFYSAVAQSPSCSGNRLLHSYGIAPANCA
jgi:hypothetical protein